MTTLGKNTEELILEAARKVFIQKGCAGARMQEIADEAGINKALLHYYFRGKDKLFEAVFRQAANCLLPVMKNVLESEIPLLQKIELFINRYIDVLLENPHLPAFVIQELNQEPARFIGYLKTVGINPAPLFLQIEQEMILGHIRPMKADHFMVNLLGICLFPFMARPVVKTVLQMNDEKYNEFLVERKREVVQFVMNSITVS